MASPTAVPGGTTRRRALTDLEKKKRRRTFLYGLLAGQLLIIALDLGGDLALRLFPNVKLHAPIPLRALVFIGMTGGIALGVLGVFFMLGLRTAGWVVGGRKSGFFSAVGRGIALFWKTAWAFGIILGVVGATAWFMIPRHQRRSTVDYIERNVDQGVQKGRDALRDAVK